MVSLELGISLIIIGLVLYLIPRKISIPIPIRIIAIIASALFAIGIILIALFITKIIIWKQIFSMIPKLFYQYDVDLFLNIHKINKIKNWVCCNW